MSQACQALRRPFAVAGCVVALAGCDGLLDVELPSQLTDQALNDPNSAADQVNSAIAHFECGYSTFAYWIGGAEDVMDPQGAVYYASGAHVYDPFPNSGDCDQTPQAVAFYSQFTVTSAMARSVYDLMNGEGGWTDAEVPNKQQLSTISALYSAATLEWFGELFCEMTVDEGPLMTPDQTLSLADEWVGRALGHISTSGDFPMPHEITPGPGGAEALAYALRSRILWAQGDLVGAAEAARMVPQGFEARVTRGGGLTRRNKVYQQGTETRYASVAGVNDWWGGLPNPATGAAWPEVIPFTGYLHLGILPDGRAVRDDGLPVRVDGPYRTTAEDAAVADSRVPVEFSNALQGGGTGYVPVKYTSDSDPIPFVNWEEIWLIRAEAEGGQAAIDLVNEIRAAHDLPLVSYADPSDAAQIRQMILEEKRRSLWLEARYIATKIQNTDLVWFPRAQGTTPSQGVQYLGGVRMLMPNDEFDLNENISRTDRATGCAEGQRPVQFQ
ncbi:MAG: hypothetical protein GEU90_00750 [Gemmatimonas sp.]|nr:hypothetical protein [Gemmatimonas sp.]